MVEQRAVAVRRGGHAVEQIRELRHLIGVDLRDFDDLFRLLLVVRDRMVRIGHADLRERHAAELAAQHERNDARQVRLVRQHLQVAHQLHMIVEAVGHAGRMVDDRQLARALFFGAGNPALDVTDRVEIFHELHAVAGANRSAQALRFRDHRVEHAAILADARAPRLRRGAAAVPEQPLEDDARVAFGRERRVRAAPGDGVGIRTREADVAGARGLARFDSELERGELRVLSRFVRQDLVDRDAGVDTSVRNRVLAFACAPPGRPAMGTQARLLSTDSRLRCGASDASVGVSS